MSFTATLGHKAYSLPFRVPADVPATPEHIACSTRQDLPPAKVRRQSVSGTSPLQAGRSSSKVGTCLSWGLCIAPGL